ncbi:MAG: ribonuclease HII [Chloroflexi bacterium]|nr:ribonuclease HII [Chloroflexota bacterium]
MMRQTPTFTQEEYLWRKGYRLVAGIDEVGRGPLAGPVVAAAVILSSQASPPWLSQVRDSKQLSPAKREHLAMCIRKDAVAVGIGTASHEEIDSQGIVGATRAAMCSAVARLARRPEWLLIDAVRLPQLPIPQTSLIKGDALCLSIAAASIVAKVHRDRLMEEYDRLYPGYGFGQHKGYPTSEHLTRLDELGSCPIHRRSFAPVRDRDE